MIRDQRSRLLRPYICVKLMNSKSEECLEEIPPRALWFYSYWACRCMQQRPLSFSRTKIMSSKSWNWIILMFNGYVTKCNLSITASISWTWGAFHTVPVYLMCFGCLLSFHHVDKNVFLLFSYVSNLHWMCILNQFLPLIKHDPLTRRWGKKPEFFP